MSVYPPPIAARLKHLRHASALIDAGAESVEASFVCGTYVRFFLAVDAGTNVISRISFQSNGCGHAVASAESLCEWAADMKITEMAGLEQVESLLYQLFGPTDPARRHCREMCMKAFAAVFSAYRTTRLQTYSGEDPLVCTCFGISESGIEDIVRTGAATVDEVTKRCNAGSGCGSCRMLIQEIIDSHIVGPP